MRKCDVPKFARVKKVYLTGTEPEYWENLLADLKKFAEENDLTLTIKGDRANLSNGRSFRKPPVKGTEVFGTFKLKSHGHYIFTPEGTDREIYGELPKKEFMTNTGFIFTTMSGDEIEYIFLTD